MSQHTTFKAVSHRQQNCLERSLATSPTLVKRDLEIYCHPNPYPLGLHCCLTQWKQQVGTCNWNNLLSADWLEQRRDQFAAYNFLADGTQQGTVFSLETNHCEIELALSATTHTVFHKFTDNVSIRLLMELITYALDSTWLFMNVRS